jgi:hypothetical protein
MKQRRIARNIPALPPWGGVFGRCTSEWPLRRRLALGLTVGLLLAACGTTVDGASEGATSGLPGPAAPSTTGVGSPSGTGLGSGTASDGEGRPSGTGAGLQSSGGRASSAPAPGRARASGAPVVPSGGTVRSSAEFTGRGVTKSTVYIGLASSDIDSYAKVVGLNGISSGDTEAQTRAIIKDIERRGGLGGRKIELVVHKYSAAQLLSDPATANQAACADWTQDHQVFLVFSLTDPTLLACLKKTNTPLIDAGAGWDIHGMRIYQHVFSENPDYFLLGAMLGERYERLATARMVARKYFQKWDTTAGRPGTAPMKLGLVMPDVPEGHLCVQLITNELKKYGIKPAFVVMTSSSSGGQEAAVLRFQTEGITHVIGASLRFMTTADGQHYYPRYFIRVAVDTIAETAPARQLAGAMAQSLIPANDVGEEQDPGDPSPATTYCKKVMKAAGQHYAARTELWVMESMCDSFFFVKDAIDASGTLTTAGLRSGLESLRGRPSALTWVSHLGPGPGQHAAGHAMRDILYDAGCSCFKYTDTRNYTES